jgi:hypothetical protein
MFWGLGALMSLPAPTHIVKQFIDLNAVYNSDQKKTLAKRSPTHYHIPEFLTR